MSCTMIVSEIYNHIHPKSPTFQENKMNFWNLNELVL